MQYRRRLRSRIVVSFLLLGTLLTTLFAFAVLLLRSRLEEQLINNTLQREVANFVEFKRANPDESARFAFSREIIADVFGPAKFANIPFAHQNLETGVYDRVDEGSGGTRYYKLAVQRDKDFRGYLQYDYTQEALSNRQLVVALGATVGVFALLSLLLGIWSSRRVISPVTELVSRVRGFARSGRHEALAPHFAADEVGELAAALDDYSSRLTSVVERDREFNADVSHELRTPLSVIHGAAELLLTQSDLTPKTRERLLRIERAVRQSTELTTALLLLSRGEKQGPSDGETSDVGAIVEQVIDVCRNQLGSKPIDIHLERLAAPEVEAPAAVLAVALTNLIGNAFKYTREGGVGITVHEDRVTVIDSGPGVNAEEAQRLFERGYRARGVDAPGSGIGLAIVRRLCDLYGWQVTLAPRTDIRGTIAELRFARK